MTSHFGVMLLFALFVSVVFAVLMKDEPREQIRFGALLFAAFAGAGLAMGWLMFAFPL